MTSDKYARSLRVFAHLFNSYWSSTQLVQVFGYSEPDFALPGNFMFISLGDQRDYPVEKWSDSLLKILEMRSKNEHFILMLEDYWILRRVDKRAVRVLYDYMRQFGYVIKMDLCADRLYAENMQDYGSVFSLDLVKSDPGSQYHMSLMTGIWNRNLLKKILVPGETPWEVELNGTRRLSAYGDDILVLGTRQWPCRHILGNRNGDGDKFHLEGLAEQDKVCVDAILRGDI